MVTTAQGGLVKAFETVEDAGMVRLIVMKCLFSLYALLIACKHHLEINFHAFGVQLARTDHVVFARRPSRGLGYLACLRLFLERVADDKFVIINNRQGTFPVLKHFPCCLA